MSEFWEGVARLRVSSCGVGTARRLIRLSFPVCLVGFAARRSGTPLAEATSTTCRCAARGRFRELRLRTWQGMANPQVRWQNVCAGSCSSIRITGTSQR